ncbi:MAG: prohibitin family protein, partial [Spirulinaceae cyanobacterium RM2_2_10]|nr:prohibitin family protein [Spirulinaceae cyanobacterium RM2_2_10]
MRNQPTPSLQPLIGGIIAALLILLSFNSFIVIN